MYRERYVYTTIYIYAYIWIYKKRKKIYICMCVYMYAYSGPLMMIISNHIIKAFPVRIQLCKRLCFPNDNPSLSKLS